MQYDKLKEIHKGWKEGNEIIIICRLKIVYLAKLKGSTKQRLEKGKEFMVVINYKMKKSRAFLNSAPGAKLSSPQCSRQAWGNKEPRYVILDTGFSKTLLHLCSYKRYIGRATVVMETAPQSND